MDSEVRQAQLILKGTLSEMAGEEQIQVERTMLALREVAYKFPDSIEFAATMYLMELTIGADILEEESAPPQGLEING